MKNVSRCAAVGVASSVFVFVSSIVVKADVGEDASQMNKKHGGVKLHITADPLNHTVTEHLNPTTIVSKEELSIKTEPTIGETLSKEVGVHSSYFGPGASRPIIRGHSGGRVRMLKNGLGLLDVSSTSEDHAVAANPLSADSIEILRGPETLLYGSEAIGGVVNMTNSAISPVLPKTPFGGSVEYRQGTADDERTGAFSLQGVNGDTVLYLDYFNQRTSDIEIPGYAESDALRAQEAAEGVEEEYVRGTVENTATHSQGGSLGATYVLEKGFVGVSYTGLDSSYGVPGHEHVEGDEHGEGDEHEAEDDEHDLEDFGGVRIQLRENRFDVLSGVDVSASKVSQVRLKLGGSSYEHREIEEGEVATRFERDALDSRLEIQHELTSSLQGQLGMQMQAGSLEVTGDEAFLPDVDSYSPAVFVFEEYALNEQIRIQAGGRVEYVDLNPEGESAVQYVPVSLSTGFVWDPTARNDYSAGVSVSYAERAPSIEELFANGPHLARGIYELGNSELDEEESIGVDLSLRKNSGWVTGLMTLFYQKYSTYHALRADGGEQDDLPLYRYESVDARFWGLESEVVFHVHEILDIWAHDIDIDLQYDVVRAENETDNEELPRTPPMRAVLGIEYEYRNAVSTRIETVLVSEQDRLASFENKTDGYQLVNAHIEFDAPMSSAKGLKMFIRGTNLTNEEARVHTSFLKDLAPLRGRSFLFGVRGNF